MSINKANQVKLALGIIIQPSPVWGDILSQAKLNLDSSIQKSPESVGSFSLEKLSAPALGKTYAAGNGSWIRGCEI